MEASYVPPGSEDGTWYSQRLSQGMPMTSWQIQLGQEEATWQNHHSNHGWSQDSWRDRPDFVDVTCNYQDVHPVWLTGSWQPPRSEEEWNGVYFNVAGVCGQDHAYAMSHNSCQGCAAGVPHWLRAPRSNSSSSVSPALFEVAPARRGKARGKGGGG